MRNQIFHSPGNEEGELAKIPGDGDPPPPHWDLYLCVTKKAKIWLKKCVYLKYFTRNSKGQEISEEIFLDHF